MATAGTDVEVVVLEELDFTPSCDHGAPPLRGPKCEKEAAWLGVASCCGDVCLRCEGHKRSLDALFAMWQSIPGGCMRHRCGRITQWVRWEPLG